ncbi:MAG: TIGR02449 family protein [Haliea sp.]|jgi:cell division protein ZapB|uniref:TIGR02449 family protein n=1 Tax=Haliea sp. TaxID=1932666 RepID=UPI000C66E2D9|nr:TIGR02449 family protein [Haliea sp.]MBM68844.1 TIGR02449 family protein [Haliea sp.]|tara:strand:- start:7642 stop:7851 length:210 start_codon:yes stop_codon:yes gene_type:complete
MADTQLQTLETRIDELIALCRDLNRENQRLKRENDSWRLEREDLISKNNLARNKVEAMIARLRSMEQRQ